MVLIGGLIGITIAVVIGVNLLPSIAGSVDSSPGVAATPANWATGGAQQIAYCDTGATPTGGLSATPGEMFCSTGETWLGLVQLLPLVVAAIIIIGAVSYISNR